MDGAKKVTANGTRRLLASATAVLHTVLMRLHRFFVEELLAPVAVRGAVKIKDKDLLHQWKHVFRFQVGHQLILLDNSGSEFQAQISSLSGIVADLIILSSKISGATPSEEIWLFMSLIKKDKFEWVLEKGTEIGVSHFIPVLADRSEKKNFNHERGVKIIKEAAEQSGRAKLPELGEICDLDETLKMVEQIEQKNSFAIALDPTGDQKFDKKLFENATKMALFIGPEGGWSERELALFKKQNVAICTLGTAILRAETAAIVAPGLLLF